MMRFVLFGNTFQTKKSMHAEQLLATLRTYGAEVYIDSDFYHFLPRELTARYQPDGIFEGDDFDADMVISVGGDGTFLKSAMRVGRRGIPILGINTGRLGFLADISPDEIGETFDEIFSGSYQVEDRSVLQLDAGEEGLKGYPFALNEIAILKRDSSSMISIHTHINGALLTTYQADGIIVATPTGSTAYSLSVGGPIMVPHAGTIALTPVAPHSLNMRPIVIRDDWEVTLDVESRNHNFLASIDGRSQSFPDDVELMIRRAPYPINLVKRHNNHFFETLRHKLLWGADKRI